MVLEHITLAIGRNTQKKANISFGTIMEVQYSTALAYVDP